MDITKITKPARKLLPLKTCGAVIVAAGTASRMGGIDKVMAELKGEPMIVRTVRTFQNCDAISEIVIVTRPDLILPITTLTREMPKVKAVVAGGKSRQESVNLGLGALSMEVKMGTFSTRSHSMARMIKDATGVAFMIWRTGEKSVLIKLDFAVSTAIRIPSTVPRRSPEMTRKSEVPTDSQNSHSPKNLNSFCKTESGDGIKMSFPIQRWTPCHTKSQKTAETA